MSEGSCWPYSGPVILIMVMLDRWIIRLIDWYLGTVPGPLHILGQSLVDIQGGWRGLVADKDKTD